MAFRFTRSRTILGVASAGFMVIGLGVWNPLQSQGVGNAIAPIVNSLNIVGVPDVNAIGLLDGQGVVGGINPGSFPIITKPGQRAALVQLGKELFWDMQVGGDGIQACASCHFHAGADHRTTGQMSPGFKGGDFVHDLMDNNGTLTTAHFGGLTNRGLPVSEAALIGEGSTADLSDADGTPGTPGAKPNPANDVNDVVSSAGPRGGDYIGISAISTERRDRATLKTDDSFGAASATFNRNGFNFNFSSNTNVGDLPDTVRRVEPRNSPTVLNAVYNFRNFWDGRADGFFNGRSPLGFRDPNARVKIASGGSLTDEQLAIPLSSLASQAVGPIGSEFEMVYAPRPVMDLGKKMVGRTPLYNQKIACTDPVLGGLVAACVGSGVITPGSTTYAAQIAAIFDDRFHNSPLCVNADGNQAMACDPNTNYTLMQYNFPLFFGLAVQAYEATLFTEDTIVDLLAGYKVTGNLTLGRRTVNTLNLPFEGCIVGLQANTSAVAVAAATNACATHYQKFIHPKAVSGSESNLTATPVAGGAGTAIGGCGPTAPACTTPAARRDAGIATLLSVNRGLGRFFAGATGCSVCHFNPEFTGATVATITGFGAGPGEPLPPGQQRKVLERRVAMERMIAFNGLPTVYDTGFYNIGVRPTPEDISLGKSIDGVPLAFTKLMQDGPTAAAGSNHALSFAAIASLTLPTGTNNLTPLPFAPIMTVACGPGLVNPNANNNPNNNCNPTVIPGERILRNGAFKASGLRNVKFTGPYFHNGSKMNLRQVLEFYKTAGHFTTLNLNNLDAGLRVFNLGATDEASVVELMETGLTDWRVAFEEGKFSHPQICVPNGHNPSTGASILADVPAVGAAGNTAALQTFQERLDNITGRAHNLVAACGITDVPATVDHPATF